QNIYLRVYYPPVVIGLTALIAMVVTFYFSFVHAIIIFISMLIIFCLVKSCKFLIPFFIIVKLI
ncbi:hypothetical protein BUY39_12870, partial [Staphylococcus cohnii]